MTSRIRYTNKGIFEYQSNIGHTCALNKKKRKKKHLHKHRLFSENSSWLAIFYYFYLKIVEINEVKIK